MSIPIYSAAGRRLDIISQGELERLEAAGRIARIVRRRDGSPARAYLRPRDGTEACGSVAALAGQRYVYRERLVNCRVWTFRRLGRGDELRPYFSAVLNSCLAFADKGGSIHGRKPDRDHSSAGSVVTGGLATTRATQPPEGIPTMAPVVSLGPS